MNILPELAGHRAARLFLLDLGLFRVAATARHPGRVIGIPGFVVQTDRGAHVLIDTGFPPDYATDPLGAAAADGLEAFGRLEGFSARQTLAGALATLGLAARDIAATVLTHSHIDHAGGLPAVTGAPVVLGAAERALPRPAWFGGRSRMDWPQADYRIVAGETALLPGLALIPTPGHTPGHLSVLFSPPAGAPVMLAADAINRESEPAEGFPDAEDPVAARASAARIMAVVQATGARLIWGHEPAQWPALAKAPLALA